MAFHHIHNQNIRHTHSFVAIGKESQCWDTVWPQLLMIKTSTGLILHPEGLDVRGGEDQAWWHFSLVYWEQDLRITAAAPLPVCHCHQQGRSLLLHYTQLSRGQSFEDVKSLRVLQKMAAEQREEIQVKTSAWRAGLASRTRREQPGSWHGLAGHAARARCSTTGAATAQIYLGPCLFYNWNLVATITFKWLSGHYVISEQHWN